MTTDTSLHRRALKTTLPAFESLYPRGSSACSRKTSLRVECEQPLQGLLKIFHAPDNEVETLPLQRDEVPARALPLRWRDRIGLAFPNGDRNVRFAASRSAAACG